MVIVTVLFLKAFYRNQLINKSSLSLSPPIHLIGKCFKKLIENLYYEKKTVGLTLYMDKAAAGGTSSLIMSWEMQQKVN